MERIVGNFYAKRAEVIGNSSNSFLSPRWTTVSIGVRQAVSKRKLGAAIVRITGPNTDGGGTDINRLADIVISQLNAGFYIGPENLTTSSPYARGLLVSINNH
ncbi:hypothetical protein JKG47_20290 [Acidithiobacillus sp. MC6.1]|nr:hypothetical protein [Acidithiobacillus sp. MC6.1]